MGEMAREILPVNIEDEMKQSYLDYAMSVIVGRALPDVRDGLKPVHRRVLFAMSELGNDWNKPYKKSARVVGDVIGKYHPHGDSAVYDTIVRMAQPFSMRYCLVDGQGNFGSIDGDSAAAMRYTEVRMAKIAHQMLADLDKETVDFVPNYDDTEQIPDVLPTRVPCLLVNGSDGIAVGMATKIPPHNLGEVVDACIALVDQPDLSIDDLMEYVPGPDFPTGAVINGKDGIIQAYRTGRGRIHVRAVTNVEEEKSGKQSIIITELPYQVNKARLIEKIAELVKDKKIEGITALRDESDKDGMRVVIELRRAEVPEVILNNLFAQTQMQIVYGINIVALLDGQPQTLNLSQILNAFLRHRREVVTRRTIFELRKARERAHLLEGLAVAIASIDPIIAMIKASPNAQEAKEKLLEQVWQPGAVGEMLERAGDDACKPEDLDEKFGLHADGYHLSPAQAQAILEMRLHRLTGLEHDKILNEYTELLSLIEGLLEILRSPERLMAVIREEFVKLREEFGDERRTKIIDAVATLSIEDLIAEEELVVTLSRGGYAKAQSLDEYRAQHRGGRGKSATKMKDEDVIDRLLIANTHDTILCFTNAGKVYWKRTFELPRAGPGSRGKPIVNLLPLEEGESVNAILPVKEYSDDQFIFFATENGTVKKTPLTAFSRPRANGIRAIGLEEGNKLIGVDLTDGNQEVILFSDTGKAMRFKEENVRSMGRTSKGVRGIRLKEGQKVISLVVARDDADVLTATENGFGKRTAMSGYPTKGRGGQGVIAIQTSDRNGQLVGAIAVAESDEMMLITDGGTLVRTRVDEVSQVGRNTQGVTLIKLSKGEQLVGLARIAELDVGDEDDVIDGEPSVDPDGQPNGDPETGDTESGPVIEGSGVSEAQDAQQPDDQ
ncbi:DNA gyrase subunit A [Pelagibaculum spongiae]|uniref:DNA gyrase subunit A n=1 Tax=Pelagibaculum spongiae TaxID=2080658 RepID=A0A2V1GXW6_9GAMM|nr:DNA gyrase subunit A [Pelagibaculum spongiae]PVZ71626.1 DNA gyrase subunit A [Pelagibaculum spongiae]